MNEDDPFALLPVRVFLAILIWYGRLPYRKRVLVFFAELAVLVLVMWLLLHW